MTERQHLPANLHRIADVVGEGAALTIAREKGGTRIYIPARMRANHWLAELIGFEKAQLLAEHFRIDRRRGFFFDMPLVAGTYRQMLAGIAKSVQDLDDKGASATEIARKVGVTARSVHKHRSRHRGAARDKRQGSLF